MALRLVAIDIDTLDPTGLAAFWSELLGRDVVTEPAGVLLPGDDTQVGLRFVATDVAPEGPHRVHLHITSDTPEDQERTVATALRLGGRHLDVGQRPDEGHIVLADPAGYALCVIEPGNRFLAGCGRFGEVAGDGARDVGVFWHEALGWPLVWDQDEETAVQSPHGGTKVAWGGPPVTPKHGRNHHRFSLAADDVDVEVARLVGLGATVVERRDDVVELTDVDDNELTIHPA
jgi:hypothetical protein